MNDCARYLISKQVQNAVSIAVIALLAIGIRTRSTERIWAQCGSDALRDVFICIYVTRRKTVNTVLSYCLGADTVSKNTFVRRRSVVLRKQRWLHYGQQWFFVTPSAILVSCSVTNCRVAHSLHNESDVSKTRKRRKLLLVMIHLFSRAPTTRMLNCIFPIYSKACYWSTY